MQIRHIDALSDYDVIRHAVHVHSMNACRSLHEMQSISNAVHAHNMTHYSY